MAQVFEHWLCDIQVYFTYDTYPLQLAYDASQADGDCGTPGQIVGHTITAIQCRMARRDTCPSRGYLVIWDSTVKHLAEGWVDLSNLPLYNGNTWGRTWRHHTTGLSCSAGDYGCHNCADVTWELTSINATDTANRVIYGYFYTDETCSTKLGVGASNWQLVYAGSTSRSTMDGVVGGGSTEFVGSLQGELSTADAFDVTTLPATDIVNNSVKVHGHVSKIGTESTDIVQYGFDIRQATEEEYSVHNEWFFDTPITTESLFSGTFGGVTIPDNTTFYFRAKAANADGTWVYGEELTFSTGAFRVVTNDAADITAVSATISGSATVDASVTDVLIKKTGLHYGLDQYMNGGASFYNTITPTDDVDFELALSYLYPGTLYYCVASAIAISST